MVLITEQEIITRKYGRQIYGYFLTGGQAGYGIRISDTQGGDCADAPELSTDREAVLELLLKLARGLVTPVTLADIAYDWLCERSTLFP